MNEQKTQFKKRVRLSLIVMLAGMGISVNKAYAQDTHDSGKTLSREQADVQKFGLIAAAVAFGFGAIGAGIAIANVGAAAMGAIGEKPEIASQALIFIALAEGLVVFGFITALMILGKL